MDEAPAEVEPAAAANASDADAPPPALLAPHEVADTPHNRAVVAFCDDYLAALTRRDAAAILGMVADDYHDNASTHSPADDIDSAALDTMLPEMLGKIERFDVAFRYVGIVEEDGVIAVEVDKDGEVTVGGEDLPIADRSLLRLRATTAGFEFLSGL